MRNGILGVVSCGLIALAIIGVSMRPALVAQESAKSAAKSEKGEGAKKAARSGDRLPANYAKIGVSEDQRKKIYEIQNKFDSQVTALQKQIADLKAKEIAEVEAVLTPEQKKALQAVNEESKKKAADKKKAAEAKADDAKKGDK